MLDGMISAMTSCYMIYLGSNENPIKQGSGYQTVCPYRVLPASDREFAFAVGSEKLWTAFCKAIDRPDLEHHPDYVTNSTRIAQSPGARFIAGRRISHAHSRRMVGDSAKGRGSLLAGQNTP